MSLSPRSTPALRAHLLPLVAIGALFTWMFARFLAGDLYLSDSDLYDYFLPAFLSPIRRWSSFEFGGFPLFADPHDFSYYLPRMLVGAGGASWTILVMSAYVMAACFAYAYVYNLTGSRRSAAFTALAYSLSEAMLEGMGHLGAVHAAAWLPLVALSIDRVRERQPLAWMAVGAVAVASCVLSGDLQTATYAMHALGLYALVGLIAGRAPAGRYAATVGMFLLGGLLAAVKLVPLFDADSAFALHRVTFEQFVGDALSGSQTLSVMFPTVLHGDPRDLPTYVGVVTLLFALVGLSRIRHDWRIACWAIIGAWAFLLALGTLTPLVNFAYSLPFYDRFAGISHHLFLFAFGAAVLSGVGVAALERRDTRPLASGIAAALLLIALGLGSAGLANGALPRTVWIQLVFAIGSAVVLVWFHRFGPTRLATTLLVALLVGDLLNAVPYHALPDGLEFPSVDADAVTPSVHARALAAALAPDGGRLLALGGAQRDQVVPSGFARPWRIPVAEGYGASPSTRYAQVAPLDARGAVQPALLGDRDSALDTLGVKYLLVTGNDNVEDFRRRSGATSRWRETRSVRTSRSSDRGADIDSGDEDTVAVFENLRALPRAWVVSSTLPLDDAAALGSIHGTPLPDGTTFDPRHTALVAGDGPQLARPPGSGGGSTRLVTVGDGKIILSATAPSGGFLVLAENYHRAWRARIDGQAATLYRTNVTLQGVVLPAGTHEIVFSLESRSLRAGTYASAIAAVLCVAFLLADGVGRRRRRAATPMTAAPADTPPASSVTVTSADAMARREDIWRRRCQGMAGVGVVGLTLFGLAYWYTIEPAPAVRVRWRADVAPSRQATLERKYLLKNGRIPLDRSIAYDLLDTRTRNVRSLVQDPAVADTGDIDRDSFSIPFETEYGQSWMWAADRVPGLRSEWVRLGVVGGLALMAIGGLSGEVAARQRAKKRGRGNPARHEGHHGDPSWRPPGL